MIGRRALDFVLLHAAIAWLNLVIPPYASRSCQSWLEIVRSAFADDTFVCLAMVVAAHAYELLETCAKTRGREMRVPAGGQLSLT